MNTIVDGEVVALDSDGRPSFNALQNALRGCPVYFYAFDLLAYRGKNVMRLSASFMTIQSALSGSLCLRSTENPLRFK